MYANERNSYQCSTFCVYESSSQPTTVNVSVIDRIALRLSLPEEAFHFTLRTSLTDADNHVTVRRHEHAYESGDKAFIPPLYTIFLATTARILQVFTPPLPPS